MPASSDNTFDGELQGMLVEDGRTNYAGPAGTLLLAVPPRGEVHIPGRPHGHLPRAALRELEAFPWPARGHAGHLPG